MSKKWIYVLLGLLTLALVTAGCGGQGADKSKGKVLKVGSEPTFPPFEFQDEKSKEFTGFDMDLIRAMAKEMGYEVQIVNMGFDGLIPALESGQIDMIASGMTITSERAEKVLFTKPYYKSGLSVMVPMNNQSIQGIHDLEGKKISVQLGTTGAMAAKKIPGAVIREFNTAPEAYLELKNGGVDAALADAPVNDYYLATVGSKDAKVVGGIVQAEDYGFAVNKKNKELLEKLDKALAAVKQSGEYEKIYMKWFNKKPE